MLVILSTFLLSAFAVQVIPEEAKQAESYGTTIRTATTKAKCNECNSKEEEFSHESNKIRIESNRIEATNFIVVILHDGAAIDDYGHQLHVGMDDSPFLH